jgi:hypothetical protein
VEQGKNDVNAARTELEKSASNFLRVNYLSNHITDLVIDQRD